MKVCQQGHPSDRPPSAAIFATYLGLVNLHGSNVRASHIADVDNAKDNFGNAMRRLCHDHFEQLLRLAVAATEVGPNDKARQDSDQVPPALLLLRGGEDGDDVLGGWVGGVQKTHLQEADRPRLAN